jgi:hypothetical protein
MATHAGAVNLNEGGTMLAAWSYRSGDGWMVTVDHGGRFETIEPEWFRVHGKDERGRRVDFRLPADALWHLAEVFEGGVDAMVGGDVYRLQTFENGEAVYPREA